MVYAGAHTEIAFEIQETGPGLDIELGRKRGFREAYVPDMNEEGVGLTQEVGRSAEPISKSRPPKSNPNGERV